MKGSESQVDRAGQGEAVQRIVCGLGWDGNGHLVQLFVKALRTVYGSIVE
jgi:hypothetical protein